MKKLITTVAILSSLAVFAAADNTLISFSTKGPDTYADGSYVLDGECYALVWTASGASFGGFAANGQPVNAADKLVLTAPVAKDKHCPLVVFQIDSAIVEAQYKNGSFGVYLLDTRLKTADGSYKVGGINEATGYAKTVNAASAAGVAADGSSGVIGASGSSVQASEIAKIPEGLAEAKIKAIKLAGENVIITIENAASFLQYTLAELATPQAKDGEEVGEPVMGDADGEATIVVPKSGDNKIFMLKRK